MLPAFFVGDWIRGLGRKWKLVCQGVWVEVMVLRNNDLCRKTLGWVNLIFGNRAGPAVHLVACGSTVKVSCLGFQRVLAWGGSRFGAYDEKHANTPLRQPLVSGYLNTAPKAALRGRSWLKFQEKGEAFVRIAAQSRSLGGAWSVSWGCWGSRPP